MNLTDFDNIQSRVDKEIEANLLEALEKEYKMIGKNMPDYKNSNVLLNGVKVGNKFLVISSDIFFASANNIRVFSL